MTLGDHFPDGLVRVFVNRHLAPGAVIKLYVRMDDGHMHEKRFVVLTSDETTVTLVINSSISGFIAARPDMLKCQVAMPKHAHPFMDHDSQVDCSRTRVYDTAEVVAQLTGNIHWLLGRISPDLRDDIVAALKRAPTLSVVEVKNLCGFLESNAYD